MLFELTEVKIIIITQGVQIQLWIYTNPAPCLCVI